MKSARAILLVLCIMFMPSTLRAQVAIQEQNLNEVAAFLQECHVFFIATVEGNQPRVRPFGVAEVVNGKLYLTTGRKKNVYKQLESNNGRFEICALKADYSQWIRISGRLVDEDNAEVRQTILDRNKSLTGMYSANDGNFVTPYIADGEARFFTFKGEEKRIKFSNGSENNAQESEEALSTKKVFTVVYANSDDGFVNIREQPSSKANILGKLHTPFDGLGEGVLIEKRGDWSKVNVENVVGWVYNKYVGFDTWCDNSGNSILVANIPKTTIYENAEVENGPIKFAEVEKGTIIADRFEDFGEYYALPTAGNYLLIRKSDAQIVSK